MPVAAVLPDLLKGRLLGDRRGAAKLKQILRFRILLRMGLALDRRRPSRMRVVGLDRGDGARSEQRSRDWQPELGIKGRGTAGRIQEGKYGPEEAEQGAEN
jgi:hypothetical protein